MSARDRSAQRRPPPAGRASLAALLGGAFLLGACGGMRPPPPSAATGSEPPPLAGAQTAQSLYRVDVEGVEGRGRMRMVLREGPELFQLAASDPLGRALWTLTVAPRRALLVDHRRRLYCSGSEAVVPPEVGLAELPLAALPRVLAGRLPIAPRDPAPSDGRLDFDDEAGRRWSAQFAAGELSSWTLWQQGEPLLWWGAASRGGILSHRQGSQFRWRRTVREERGGEISAAPPTGYAAGACSAWDEPPPTG